MKTLNDNSWDDDSWDDPDRLLGIGMLTVLFLFIGYPLIQSYTAPSKSYTAPSKSCTAASTLPLFINSQKYKQKYELLEIVPNQVILIRALTYDVRAPMDRDGNYVLNYEAHDYSKYLSLGVREVSEKYNIISISAITQFVYRGSSTNSLLITVRPK